MHLATAYVFSRSAAAASSALQRLAVQNIVGLYLYKYQDQLAHVHCNTMVTCCTDLSIFFRQLHARQKRSRQALCSQSLFWCADSKNNGRLETGARQKFHSTSLKKHSSIASLRWCSVPLVLHNDLALHTVLGCGLGCEWVLAGWRTQHTFAETRQVPQHCH